MTESKRNQLKRKLQESRYRLITQDSSFAELLTGMIFVAVSDISKMSTNGYCIYINATWLDKLNDYSLDYALSHQILHIKKGHLCRERLYRGDRYHYACNVIVNSFLVDRGYIEEKLPGIGELPRRTLFPNAEGCTVSPEEAFRMCPMDPALFNASQRSRILFDTDEYWDRQEDRGENGIIILSPADEDPYCLKPSERIYGEIKRFLTRPPKKKMDNQNQELISKKEDDLEDFTTEFMDSDTAKLKEILQEVQNLRARDETDNARDNMVERVVRDIKIIPKDWRSILNHFIMVSTRDYDFVPPDKRFQDDLFMPDFNEDITQKQNVLFMVDISASLTNDEISMALRELSAAIEQFNGMLQGTVGFFDSQVRCAFPITTEAELYKHVPAKGGGTDMHCVFDYISKELSHDLPSEIVIMTDGKCDFPEYSATLGIPVLWLLTNNKIRIPWGHAAYFERKKFSFQ